MKYLVRFIKWSYVMIINFPRLVYAYYRLYIKGEYKDYINEKKGY